MSVFTKFFWIRSITIIMLVFAFLFAGCGEKEVSNFVSDGNRPIMPGATVYRVEQDREIDKNVTENVYCLVSDGYVYANSRNNIIYHSAMGTETSIYTADKEFQISKLSSNASEEIVVLLVELDRQECVVNVIDLTGKCILAKNIEWEMYEEIIDDIYYDFGNIYCFTGKGIYCLLENQTKWLTYKYDSKDASLRNCINETDIILFSSDINGSNIIILDKNTLNVKEKRSFTTTISWAKCNNRLCYYSQDGLVSYNYSAESDEMILLFSELGSDMNSIRDISFFSNGKIAIFIKNTDCRLIFVSDSIEKNNDDEKIHQEEIDDRTILSFLSVNPSLFSGDISSFNKNDNDYKIKTLPATKFDRYDMALTSSEYDLFECSATRYLQYAKNGYLYDITAFINNSSIINKEDYVDRLFSDLEIDGKIYLIPRTMMLRSLCVPEDLLDGKTSWTVDEFLDFMEKYPNAIAYKGFTNRSIEATKSDIASLAINMDDLTDSEGHINTTRLKEILHRIDSFQPTVISRDVDERIKDGDAVITPMSITTPIVFLDYETKVGRKLVPIGYPAAKGCLSKGAIVYETGVGISPSTKEPEASWRFAEYFASRSVSVEKQGAAVPTRKEKFEEAMNEGTDREHFRMEGVEYFPVTQADIDKIKKAYAEADIFTEEFLTLSDIIYEEAMSYYAGDKNVDDVVAVIANRYNLFIDEQQ